MAHAALLPVETRGALRPISVLIVDDSAVARAAMTRIINSDGQLRVAHSAAGALAAIAWLQHARVDVVLLDLEMPGVDGLAALPRLIAAGHGAQILIVSSTAREGAQATLRALALGAADTLTKPAPGQLNQLFGRVLIDRVLRLGRAAAVADNHEHLPLRSESRRAVELLAIGASTGGLRALADLLSELPAGFTAPILVTQHLPPTFMPYFADQLGAMAGRHARVARDGDRPRQSEILVAPGHAHLRLVRDGSGPVVALSTEKCSTRCCPSVDPMLGGAADIAGAGATAVILTGMGRDGALGAQHIVDRGGSVIVQDRVTSAVWGMPGTVARAGLASMVASPKHLARHLVQRGSA